MRKRGLAMLERIGRGESNHSEKKRRWFCEVKRRVCGNRSVLGLLSIGPPLIGNPKPTIQKNCEPK